MVWKERKKEKDIHELFIYIYIYIYIYTWVIESSDRKRIYDYESLNRRIEERKM